MNVCGVICEYNPFHTGHAYQINQIKKLGMDVVCVMSGDFTQRAEGVCRDKLLRAGDAVRNGADIVLELPFPFSCLGAEGFARAGVQILADSGLCTHIAFGSECADLELLTSIANALDKSFTEKIRAFQKGNPSVSFAEARSFLIRACLGDKAASVLENPNDILAVEYLRANAALGNPLVPIAIKRTTPRGGLDESFASSSYIRKKLALAAKDKADEIPRDIKDFLPYSASMSEFFTDDAAFEVARRVSLMTKSASELSEIAEVPTGAGYTIIKSAVMSDSEEEMKKMLSSKCFTDAKIRRMLLFSFFGVTKSDAAERPGYTTLLSFSARGRELLAMTKKKRRIIVASRISHIKKSKIAFKQYAAARRAGEVLKKCR